MDTAQHLSRRSWLKGTGALIGAAALGPVLLSSCGSGGSPGASSTSAKSATSGTLTIMTPQGEISDTEKAAFEKAHPGLTLSFITTDPSRLNAMLAAGNPPDLVRDAGTDVTPYIASRGVATPLDDYIAKSSVIKDSDILPINDVWKWDGKAQGAGSRYGLAKDWSQDSMWWYSTKAWQAAGLSEPDPSTPVTYDQLLEDAKKLTVTSGGKNSVNGLFTTTARFDVIASMAATAGGRILSEDLATADFSSAEAQKAIQWLLDVVAAKANFNDVNPSPDWDGPELIAGKQVSAQAGYWFGGFLGGNGGESLESDLKFAAAPLLGSQRISPSFGAVGYWIPAKAKNPGGAFQFMEWYCAGDGAKTRISAGNGLPSLKSMLPLLPNSSAFQQQALSVQNAELPYQKVLPLASPYALGTALDTTLIKAFTAGVSSNASAAKIGDDMTAAANKVLADGKKAVGK